MKKSTKRGPKEHSEAVKESRGAGKENTERQGKRAQGGREMEHREAGKGSIGRL